MKKTIWILPVIIAAILSAGVITTIAAREHQNPKESIMENLRYLEDVINKNLYFDERKKAQQKIDEIYTHLDNIGRDSSNSTIMPERTFTLLLKSMKSSFSDSEKAERFQKLSKGYDFTADQFSRLAGTFNSTFAKTDFARDNLSRLSSRDELIDFLAGFDSFRINDIFRDYPKKKDKKKENRPHHK